MSERRGKCVNCRYMDNYYTKGVKSFERTKYGWCCKKACIVNNGGGCEEYVYKASRKKVQEIFLKCYISDLLTEITELRKLLETEANEES